MTDDTLVCFIRDYENVHLMDRTTVKPETNFDLVFCLWEAETVNSRLIFILISA